MVWIRIIGPMEAEGSLAQSYRRLGAGAGQVDQILQIHSLRPHTMDGHMALYRSVLYHPRNTLDPALAEAIGVLVSAINGCGYCVAHHAAGLERAAPQRAEALLQALETGDWSDAFSPAEQAALDYAACLTRAPEGLSKAHAKALREAGWGDGEILEINQVAAYFAYANRTAQGLGVTMEGEVPGKSA